MMKILFVLENYAPHIGGVEVVFKNLCEGLAKKGHEIKIITHRLKGTKKKEKINGVWVHRVKCFYSRYWFTFLAIPSALRYSKKADLIHTTTYNGALPAKIAAWWRKKPSIITVHEVLGENWKTLGMSRLSASLHKLLEKMIMKLNFDRYISVSNSTKKQVEKTGIKKNKIKTIYNGVDYSFWNPKKYDRKKIRKKLGLEKKWVYLFYGRPGISKGLEYLIKAIPEIKIPNSIFLGIISKDKTYKKRYRQMMKLIQRLGIADKVKIINPVSHKELPNYIMAADCIVIPSLTEGFGFTTAESCALGKPVVCTDTTSLPEVASGRFMLVKPADPRAIARGVEKVYEGKYKEKTLKRFELQTNINNYEKTYEELI